MSAALIAALVALVCAGAMLAVQVPLNAYLGRGTGDALLAVTVNFGVGFAFLLLLCLVRGVGLNWGMFQAVPAWAWLGGLMGGTYMTIVVLSVPITGALTMAAATVLGQLVMSLVLDRIGAFGLPVHEISWQRLAGIGLVLAGLVLSRAG